jgi:O-antigen/teichoic acid export membrane protein
MRLDNLFVSFPRRTEAASVRALGLGVAQPRAPEAHALRAGGAFMRRVLEFAKRAARSADARRAALLVGATGAAQVVLLATMPILARLFDPADWGALAVAASIATIGGAIGALCYDAAIVMPRSARAARALFALSLRISVVVAAALAAALALAAHIFPGALGGMSPALAGGGGFALILTTTAFNAYGHAYGRADAYGSIAAAKFNQSFLPSLAQIGLGLANAGAAGLVAGRAAGMGLVVAILALRAPSGYRLADVSGARTLEMRAVARAYRDFILHVPRQIFVRGPTALPAIFMVAAYGATAGGLFFLAQRLVERPGALLGDALSRLPMRRFAQRRADRRPLLADALAYSAIVAAPILLGLAVLAVSADAFIGVFLGPQWTEAGAFVVVAAVWASARMASLPLTAVATVLRVQKVSLGLDALFSLRAFVIPAAAAAGAAAIEALWVFTGLSVLYHGFMAGVGVAAAARHDRALAGS